MAPHPLPVPHLYADKGERETLSDHVYLGLNPCFPRLLYNVPTEQLWHLKASQFPADPGRKEQARL